MSHLNRRVKGIVKQKKDKTFYVKVDNLKFPLAKEAFKFNREFKKNEKITGIIIEREVQLIYENGEFSRSYQTIEFFLPDIK